MHLQSPTQGAEDNPSKVQPNPAFPGRLNSFLGFKQVGIVVKELLYFILHAQHF
jgi:hypothetical protein